MPSPYASLIPLCVAIIVGCWLLSVVTREYSWVDRIWSVAPPVYAWLMVAYGPASPRLVLMAGLISLWGARLTFNFARKGGYRRGGEDYCWAIVRKRLGPVGFQLFNASFISPYQNVLIFLLVAPCQLAVEHPTPLGLADAVLTVVFLGFLVGETVADEQQWRFHQGKAARKARGEPGPEFCTAGLFRFSRHPNFFFEVSQWWVIAGFGLAASGLSLHWALIGAALLTLLFDGSTRLTEAITKSKYPAYAEYQAKTSRIIPLPPR